MTAWLAVRSFLGLYRWAWLLIIPIALGGAVWWLSAAERADDEVNQEIGRTEERSEQQAEAIKQVERANEAERQITASPDAARANCVRHSRTPQNC